MIYNPQVLTNKPKVYLLYMNLSLYSYVQK